MADVNLQSAAVRGRGFDLDDVMFSADPTEDDAEAAFKADTIREFIEFVFENPVGTLDDTQMAALRTFMGATDLPSVLAQIMEGNRLSIDRTTDGQITLSVSVAGLATEAARAALAARVGVVEAAVTALTGRVSTLETDLTALTNAVTALTARVAALERGGTPTPHSLTRYAALRPDGAAPGDFTEVDFLAAGATTSDTQDITTPASDDDMVVGLAVPVSEGILTAVAELTSGGDVNQFASMIRGNFLPTSTVEADQVTLEIDGEDHYVYCTSSTVRGIFLGSIGYRLTQTS